MHVLTCSPEGARVSTVRIGADAVDWAQELDHPGVFLLADGRVLEHHADIPVGDVEHLALRGGESIKTLSTLERVVRHMAQLGLTRSARLIALGGGTIGDLGALAACLYKRGIDLVQVPTTLVAMCDSAIGGKSAVNLPEGKNLVGSVWPATRVLIDPRYVSTLTDAEYSSGLGEVLKVAIGLDASLFELLETARDSVLSRVPEVVEQMILHAVRAKIRVVEQDPFDRGPRRLLNLGHTLGHALEAHSAGRLKHGQAVARGLHFALDVAVRLELQSRDTADRCRELLRSYGFRATPLPPSDELAPFVARDKKIDEDGLYMVLPCGIGGSKTVRMPVAEVCALLHG